MNNIDLTGNGEVTTPDGQRTVSGAFVAVEGQLLALARGDRRAALRQLRAQEPHRTTRAASHLSPKATVGITPVNGFTFYGTFAEGYRAPAVTETLVAGPHPPFAVGFPNLFTFVPNPSLRPEIGQTKEIGVNLKYDDICLQGRQAARQGERVPQRHRGLHRAGELRPAGHDLSARRAGPAVQRRHHPADPDQQRSRSRSTRTSARRASRASSSRAPTTRATGSSASRASTSAAATRPTTCRCSPSSRTRSPRTFGVRLLERKLTMSVRWQAVAAKTASEIPDRDKSGFPDFLPVERLQSGQPLHRLSADAGCARELRHR